MLHDGAGRVLVTERPPGKAMAGYWEFPGGKLQAGESEVECVVRELREELGIEVLAQHSLMALVHAYPERRVQLGIHTIDRYRGTPHGVEGQQLRWLRPDELAALQLLPADAPIVTILCRAQSRPVTIGKMEGS